MRDVWVFPWISSTNDSFVKVRDVWNLTILNSFLISLEFCSEQRCFLTLIPWPFYNIYYTDLSLLHCSPKDVYEILSELKPHISPGPDSIHYYYHYYYFKLYSAKSKQNEIYKHERIKAQKWRARKGHLDPCRVLTLGKYKNLKYIQKNKILLQLKNCTQTLDPPLGAKGSFASGMLPHNWLLADITPLHKKGANTFAKTTTPFC